MGCSQNVRARAEQQVKKVNHTYQNTKSKAVKGASHTLQTGLKFNIDPSRTRKQPPLFGTPAELETMEVQTVSYSADVEVHKLLTGDLNAIHFQLMNVLKRYPNRVREFACLAGREFATSFRLHSKGVPHRVESNTRQSRTTSIAADGGHQKV